MNSIPEVLAAHQAAWIEAEYHARAAFAHARLDALFALAHGLTVGDRFDAAYAIWDDFIDGRRDDERTEPLTDAALGKIASVFARCVPYLSTHEVLALGRRAFGKETFEVFTRNYAGAIVGRLGWFRGDTLILRTIAPRSFDLVVWDEQGRALRQFEPIRYDALVALHPTFGRSGS